MDKEIRDEFDNELDEVLSKVDLSDIDLSLPKNAELLKIVKNFTSNTDAGSYLKIILNGDFERSFSDENEEEIEIPLNEFTQNQFNKLPIGREMYILTEFDEKEDIIRRTGPYAKEPSYKIGYVHKSAGFTLFIINIVDGSTDVLIKYSYKVNTKVERE